MLAQIDEGTYYCPGEQISIQLQVHNNSSRRIKKVTAKLVQVVTYHGENLFTGTHEIERCHTVTKTIGQYLMKFEMF